MNTIKTKRPYHHSEAWLKKHAAKKQMARKPAKQAAKKEAVKKTSKKMKKQMARKPAKKGGKKPTAKKLTMQNAVTFFNRNKKYVRNIKKTTKELGKFLTEVFKTGDEKYISCVLKLFERIGYVYDSKTGFVTFENSAKVKLPKVKAEKPTSSDEKNPRVKCQHKDDGKSSTSAESVPVSAKPVAPAPEPEDISAELDTQDAEEELAELALTEKREDEDDDEFRERMREEQEIERAAEEEEDETRAEIFEAQEENGDFS